MIIFILLSIFPKFLSSLWKLNNLSSNHYIFGKTLTIVAKSSCRLSKFERCKSSCFNPCSKLLLIKFTNIKICHIIFCLYTMFFLVTIFIFITFINCIYLVFIKSMLIFCNVGLFLRLTT